MASQDDILLFLVKHATADEFLPVADPKLGDMWPFDPLHDLLLRLSGVTRYTAPLQDFEEYVGENYSFARHIEPLCDAGYICVSGVAHLSAEKRPLHDKVLGLVANYSAKPYKSYIAFHFGRENDFLKSFYKICENAEKLGLFSNGGEMATEEDYWATAKTNEIFRSCEEATRRRNIYEAEMARIKSGQEAEAAFWKAKTASITALSPQDTEFTKTGVATAEITDS